MKLSVVIGRFQPLHEGHVDLITRAKEEGEHVLVLVGSANQLPDFKNPLSYKERLELLVTVVGNEGITYRPLPDQDSDEQWESDVIGHVLSLEEDPTEVMIFCNSKDEETYRKSFLFPVTTVDNLDIDATSVRHAWYTKTLWTVEHQVHPYVMSKLSTHYDLERLSNEYSTTVTMHSRKKEGHPFGNPMEPVSFAVIIQNGKLLTGRRNGARGKGQLGLCGGFVESSETTMEACIRETKEELGVDLGSLISQGQAVCMAQCVSENLGDLGVRTLGVNYLFVINPDVELLITEDGEETTGHEWLDIMAVCENKELLFFNHNQIVRQLLSKVGGAK